MCGILNFNRLLLRYYLGFGKYSSCLRGAMCRIFSNFNLSSQLERKYVGNYAILRRFYNRSSRKTSIKFFQINVKNMVRDLDGRFGNFFSPLRRNYAAAGTFHKNIMYLRVYYTLV